MSATAPERSLKYQKPSKRLGAVAVLMAVILVVLLVCVAIAIDVGAIVLVKTQLQSASDSAALAAATRLGLGQQSVVAEAVTFADLNKQLGGSGAEINPNEVKIGIWNRGNQTFTPATNGNAVQVTTRGTNHGYFFAKAFGPQSFSSGATALAAAVPLA
ncbi:MAG: hypothetical protein H8E66_25380, partial [Planctomycetes bacterium]|nr:hypothetical protein [Planctomycetota bacterium]